MRLAGQWGVVPYGRSSITAFASTPGQSMRVASVPAMSPLLLCRRRAFAEFINVTAQPGTGVVELMPYNAPGSPECDAGDGLPHIPQTSRQEVTENEGNVVFQRGPTAWKAQKHPVWGRPPANLALQKAVERALDPQNLFNPGRFVTDAF